MAHDPVDDLAFTKRCVQQDAGMLRTVRASLRDCEARPDLQSQSEAAQHRESLTIWHRTLMQNLGRLQQAGALPMDIQALYSECVELEAQLVTGKDGKGHLVLNSALLALFSHTLPALRERLVNLCADPKHWAP